MYNNGYKTGRDFYVYNFSAEECAENGRSMVGEYMAAMDLRAQRPEYGIDEAAHDHSDSLHWDDKLKKLNQRAVRAAFSTSYVRGVAYRPFVKQYLYGDRLFAQRPAQTEAIFPAADTDNRAICVPGVVGDKCESDPISLDTELA